MREIATVLGSLDKPMEVNIPKDLVCSLPVIHPILPVNITVFTAHYYYVTVQF